MPVRVRVAEKTIIPRRSETFIQVKCDAKTAFLEGDFDPVTIAGRAGIYTSRTRVIPNSLGVFTISLLNVSAEDMVLTARKHYMDTCCRAGKYHTRLTRRYPLF